MQVRPYPYERWSRFDTGEAKTLNALAAVSLASLAVGAPAELAARLLGATLEITTGSRLAPSVAPSVLDPAQARALLREPLVGVVVETQLGGLPVRAVVELPVELAASLVDRVLGGDGSVVHPVGEALDELSLGVLGYLAARLCSRTQGAARVHAMCATREDLIAALRLEQAAVEEPTRLILWPIEIALAEAHGRARVWLPLLAGESARAARPRAPKLDVPQGLADLPLRLCAHAASVVLSHRELVALMPGDVVVPESTDLSEGPGGWYGAIGLHVLGNCNAVLPCHVQGSELTIGSRIVREQQSVGQEQAMAQGVKVEGVKVEGVKVEGVKAESDARGEPSTLTEAQNALGEGLLRDAPVELCVELARFTIPLEQLLRLRAGEVWSTGRPIGEHVVLSAAGRKVARGELVDVDGEIGVRVIERLVDQA